MKGIRYPAAQRLAYVRFLKRVLEATHNAVPEAQIAWFLADMARKIEHMTQDDFQKQVAQVLGVTALAAPNPQVIRELFIRENIKLIQSLPRNLLEQTEQLTLQAQRQGMPVKQLERLLKDRLGIAKRRAQLIARDQVSKYSGDVTKHNQTSSGITQYQWMTSRDERVRPEHRSLDGKIFNWDKPPVSDKSGSRYHPRQGFRCRCDAIPVISF